MTVATEPTTSTLRAVVNTDALRSAVSSCAGVTKNRSPHEALRCVRLATTSDKLIVDVTSLTTFLRQTITIVQVESAGEVLVNAELFSALLSKLNTDTVDLRQSSNDLQVIAGGDEFKIPIIAEKFPPYPEDDEAVSIGVEASDLLRLIRHTSFARAKETARYTMDATLFKVASGFLTCVATEGHVLSMDRLAIAEKKKAASVLLPRDAADTIARLAEDCEGEISISFADSYIRFSTDDFTFRSVLTEGTFPPYEAIIPKERGGVVTTGREMFASALERASVQTSEEYKGVALSLSKKGVLINGRSPEKGSSAVNHPCKYDGPDMRIGFNPKFLLDALRESDADEIRMVVNAPNRPGLLELGGDYRCVVMPVNLQ